MSNTGSDGTVKTARTAFRLLESLKEHNGRTIRELAADFDLSKSSIHNYLRTLERDDYVVKQGEAYHVGLRTLELGGHACHRQPIYGIAKDEITSLAEDTEEMANLAVEEHGRGVYLHRAHGDQAVRTDSYIGERFPLHAAALGKAMLAYFPEERVDAVLDEHGLPARTTNTITDRDALAAELESIREDGIAFDDEEMVKGVRCVAVPIVSSDRSVEGAISVSGPTNRFQGEFFREELPERLHRAANLINLNSTYV